MSKTYNEVTIDWVDSIAKIVDDKGNLVDAGTSILLFDQIIFLSPLTIDQLLSLKNTVFSAVDHELDKRKILCP